MVDFYTRNDGLFVTLFPVSDVGVKQWKLIAAHPDGECGKIMPHHWPRLRLRLMSFGYTFGKAPEITQTDDELMAALLAPTNQAS
jgi:hypothetical protein